MIRTFVALSAVLIMLFPAVSLAGPTPAQKCESSIYTHAARFASCRLRAQAFFAKNFDSEKFGKKLARCERTFSRMLKKTLGRNGSVCAATASVDEFESALSECIDAIGTAAAGGAFASCGDNSINVSGEHCDGSDLGGINCTTLGFDSGTLDCTSDCKFDTSACTTLSSGMCGDNAINVSGEHCDGNDFGGASCSTFGFDSGTLACTTDCKFDTSSCTTFAPETCGDNSINVSGEHCDGSDLGGENCTTLGFKSGTLSCTSSCKFDTGSCTTCASDGAPCNLNNPGACCSSTCINSSPVPACGCLPTGFTCSLNNPGACCSKTCLNAAPSPKCA